MMNPERLTILAARWIADTDQQGSLYDVGIAELTELVKAERRTWHTRHYKRRSYKCHDCGEQVYADLPYGYCMAPLCRMRRLRVDLMAARQYVRGCEHRYHRATRMAEQRHALGGKRVHTTRLDELVNAKTRVEQLLEERRILDADIRRE